MDICVPMARRRQWHPTPVLLPGKSCGQRSPVGCSPWGRWGLGVTERLHFQFLLTCIGDGNGNPLQCSCLENPRDGGALRAAVYGVAQSQTWLSNFHFHFEWSSGFPYFLQLKSEFGNKEFIIWAKVSSWSCFCWLYRASPSLAAKNIINLISVLTIWWCPCVQSSLVLLEEGVCYDHCILLTKLC